MAEYVRMPKAHYEAACNSIRAKTGKTDLITSGAMSAEIDGITGGGGGSVEGYATVTFMNGADVLFSRLVMSGDDCPDPYVQNRIELPTKESTVQYDYTFNGWATADGGSADSNALKGITEDKVLYAAYKESVRMYTVTYYDEDGVTVLHTEQVAYGGSSDYKYQKAELMFKGWTPEPTNITGDMSCYGAWIEKPNFATSSWETIAAISAAGNAADAFTVGETRDIEIVGYNGAKYTIPFEIVGFNHDDLAGGGKAGITIMSVPALTSKGPLNISTTLDQNKPVWLGANSSIRSSLNGAVFDGLPTELQAVVKTVVKKTGTYSSGWVTADTEDKVWIPSFVEMGASYRSGQNLVSNTHSIEGNTYARFTTDTDRKKYAVKVDGTYDSSTFANYVVRSPASNNSYCCIVTTSGLAGSYSMVSTATIGFCI